MSYRQKGNNLVKDWDILFKQKKKKERKKKKANNKFQLSRFFFRCREGIARNIHLIMPSVFWLSLNLTNSYVIIFIG